MLVSAVQTSPLSSLRMGAKPFKFCSWIQGRFEKARPAVGRPMVTLGLRTVREEDQTCEGSWGYTVRTCVKATSKVQGRGGGSEPVFNNQNRLCLSQ